MIASVGLLAALDCLVVVITAILGVGVVCLVPIVVAFVVVVCCLSLFAICCLLFIVSCLVFVVCCLLHPGSLVCNCFTRSIC